MRLSTLAELKAKTTAAFMARGKSMRTSANYIRIVFFAGGALTAGVAQFVTWQKDQQPTPMQIVGICGCVVVFLSAIHGFVFDRDAGEHLGLAQEAIAKAEEVSDQATAEANDERDRLVKIIEEFPDIERNIALYQCTKLMRNALEQACIAITGNEDGLVSVLTKVAPSVLAVATGFSLADQYTICVYKAVPSGDGDRYELRLVEHIRSVECGKETARVWPEGKGVAGVAFSNAREILIEDLSLDGIRAVFQPDGMVRSYDDDRYRSIVAVPVHVEGDDRPWGIVTATNDRANHFNHADQPGMKPEEAIRMLANYVALAIAMMRFRERARNPAPAVA